MPPPSRLFITISSVSRLLQEESSYHKEQQAQEARLAKMEQDPPAENADFLLKQEKQALQETKDVFPELHRRIDDARATLEQQIAADEATAPADDLDKAREVLERAKSSRG